MCCREFMEDHFQDNLVVGEWWDDVFEKTVVDVVDVVGLLAFRDSGQHFFTFIDLELRGFQDIVLEIGVTVALAVFEDDATVAAADIEDTGMWLRAEDIEEDIEVEGAGGMNFGEIDIASVVIILHQKRKLVLIKKCLPRCGIKLTKSLIRVE